MSVQKMQYVDVLTFLGDRSVHRQLENWLVEGCIRVYKGV